MNCNSENGSSLHPDVLRLIEECLPKPHSDSHLMSILHKVQECHGYLSLERMNEVAERLGVPASIVSGVSTFYHFFRLQAKGKYHIAICLGTACFVKGADKILERFIGELGIGVGEVTADGLFSIECTRCLGVCGLAPVVTINGKVFSEVKPQQVHELIHQARSSEENGPD